MHHKAFRFLVILVVIILDRPCQNGLTKKLIYWFTKLNKLASLLAATSKKRFHSGFVSSFYDEEGVGLGSPQENTQILCIFFRTQISLLSREEGIKNSRLKFNNIRFLLPQPDLIRESFRYREHLFTSLLMSV